MNQAEERKHGVEASAERTPGARESAAGPVRAAASECLPRDLLLRVLAEELIAVEAWCARHSEYFLG